MPELAQESLRFVRYPAHEERINNERRIALENLTHAGSFQSHGVRTIQERAAAPSGTFLAGPHTLPRDEKLRLNAPLGLARTLTITEMLAFPFPTKSITGPGGREISPLILTGVGNPHVQGEEILAALSRENLVRSGPYTVVQEELPQANRQRIAPEITGEAKRRLTGHEELTEKLLSIVEKEASGLNTLLRMITVRPAWSHEYEDYTGVVVDVEVAGNSNQRFALWDAISSKLDALLDSLTPEEQTFLADNVSVVVTQG